MSLLLAEQGRGSPGEDRGWKARLVPVLEHRGRLPRPAPRVPSGHRTPPPPLPASLPGKQAASHQVRGQGVSRLLHRPGSRGCLLPHQTNSRECANEAGSPDDLSPVAGACFCMRSDRISWPRAPLQREQECPPLPISPEATQTLLHSCPPLTWGHATLWCH